MNNNPNASDNLPPIMILVAIALFLVVVCDINPKRMYRDWRYEIVKDAATMVRQREYRPGVTHCFVTKEEVLSGKLCNNE